MTAPCRGVGEWGGGCGRWPGRLFCFFLEKTKNVEGAGVARWGRVRLLVVGVSIGWRTVLFFVVFFFHLLRRRAGIVVCTTHRTTLIENTIKSTQIYP